jgi:hypothetical protein
MVELERARDAASMSTDQVMFASMDFAESSRRMDGVRRRNDAGCQWPDYWERAGNGIPHHNMMS